MKIISKYKDYYDYLKGIYGEDPRLILDRRSSDHPTYLSDGVFQIFIGNLNIQVLKIHDKYYCGEADMIKLRAERLNSHPQSEIISYRIKWKDRFGYNYSGTIAVTPWGRGRQKNDLDKPPIYIKDNNKIYPFPRLEQYNVQKVLSPHDIWIELSNYLGQQVSRTEPEVPVGDDKVRILSAGFDLKTSFRH